MLGLRYVVLTTKTETSRELLESWCAGGVHLQLDQGRALCDDGEYFLWNVWEVVSMCDGSCRRTMEPIPSEAIGDVRSALAEHMQKLSEGLATESPGHEHWLAESACHVLIPV